MTKKQALLFATVLATVSTGIFFMMPGTGGSSKAGLIEVYGISSGDAVSSPIEIVGRARGYWFFEASFPVRMFDANGKELGVAIAQAQDEWMTEEFVPFKATLIFKDSGTETGFLVLQKDNPSGLPGHDDELRIQVRFSK
ncbi:MAG: hypothetical protein A3B23_01015 [Candidatus Colwellbacteria bacterium RIFCSPLOWO2_01_FULL_48_10]|uniref:Bacterial spore germination immunoglobulin-like domain-containing protein n=2 Tax=Bacteria candidate phyla TaxID=1783234 RepID=A0A1F5P2S9_9BACT|nr:MAG: hypothetical protein A2846_04055 [Candidatus Doudnabacteria bacterium RIFCSPHIGHO2_01_FULL_49_9]OGY59523.1 MAG: hypothetical protein A3B23_01015 [Candidatus Colwellbacteria bacterium RIFCSPLOWO2_01_FULL_48_10]